MKKILLCVLFIMMLGIAAFAQEPVMLEVESKSANRGEEVTINIDLKNNTGVVGLLFNLEYDESRLELIGAEDCGLVEGSVMSPNFTTKPFVMLWNSASLTNFDKDGVLAVLNFRVLDNAEAGMAFINLSYERDNIFDVNLNEVFLVVQSGGITINSDVQEENKVTRPSSGSSNHGTVSGGSSMPSVDVPTAEQSNAEKEFKFTDVKDTDWYYKAVKFAYEKGITGGVSEILFAPEDNVTRGQFITMLCRAYGISEMTGDNFSDCGDTWYTGYLAAAKQFNISNGIGDNKFAPEKEITREEMVTLIYNYLKSIGKASETAQNTMFADDNMISDWAKSAVSFASRNGYVNGKDNNVFDPQNTATRAELAQIFYNILAE